MNDCERYTNKKCPLIGSEECKALNMSCCDECPVNDMYDEDKEAAGEGLKELRSLLGGEVIELHKTRECLLCKGDSKGARDWYGTVDIGHEYGDKPQKMAEIKLFAKTGYIVPIHFPVCAKCKKNIERIWFAGDAAGVGIGAAALIMMSIRPIREALAAVNSLLPIAVFIGMAAVAFIVRALIKNGALRRARRETETNVMRLPQFAKLAENGWFEVTTKAKMSQVAFSKNLPEHGAFMQKECVSGDDGSGGENCSCGCENR